MSQAPVQSKSPGASARSFQPKLSCIARRRPFSLPCFSPCAGQTLEGDKTPSSFGENPHLPARCLQLPCLVMVHASCCWWGPGTRPSRTSVHPRSKQTSDHGCGLREGARYKYFNKAKGNTALLPWGGQATGRAGARASRRLEFVKWRPAVITGICQTK